MSWYTPHVLLLFATAILGVLLARYSWQRNPATGARYFAILMLAVAWWAGAYALELISPAQATKAAWVKVQYVGIVAFPVAWLVFVGQHTGRAHRLKRRLPLTAIVPAATFLLAATNEAHGLIWQQIELVGNGRFVLLQMQYGPWFWVHTAYSYGCILLAHALLVVNWRQEIASLYRWQPVPLLLTIMLLPFLANLLYISDHTHIDLTPFAFLLSSLALAQYIVRFRLFDITPIAQQAIVDSMHAPVLALDDHERLIYCNPAARALLPRPLHTFIGRPIQALWPQWRAGAPAIADTSANQTAELSLEVNGVARSFEVLVAPFYDDAARARGRLLSLHDVTDRKKRENLREDMTHTMVHDLRAPLSNTLLALEMLRDVIDEGDSRQQRHKLLEATHASTEKTLQLVNQILDMNRLESGALPLTRTAVALPGQFQKALDAFSPQIAHKQLQVTCSYPEALPPAYADAELLTRVLQNLLDNSIKFSPRGGQIEISAAPAPPGGKATHLLVRITDHGPGIPPGQQLRIFEKYVTAENPARGSGLGLPFCKLVLTAHGERIWVESAPGQGAGFVFTLALTPAAVPAQ